MNIRWHSQNKSNQSIHRTSKPGTSFANIVEAVPGSNADDANVKLKRGAASTYQGEAKAEVDDFYRWNFHEA